MRWFLDASRAEIPGHAKADQERETVGAALDILGIVAARDADYARKSNGVGFLRADSRRGHLLSKLSVDAALRDSEFLLDMLKLAAKYRRQALAPKQLDLQ